MGRSAMFMVMGLGMALAMIGYNINKTGSQAVEVQMGYMKYTNARNLANTAVHAGLRAFDRAADLPLSPVSFNNGTYVITDTSSNRDTLWMNTRGTYAESTYTMNLKLIRDTKPFPGVTGAIGIRGDLTNYTMNGAKCEVDGRNWSADGTTMIGSGDLTGVATMTPPDSEMVALESAGRVKGSPATKVDTTTADPGLYINEYVASADYIINTPGTYAGGIYGSAANPVIVVCNTNSEDTSFSIKFSGKVTGWGVLAVQGNVQFTGSIEWYGLVVVFGKYNVIDFGMAGNPQIVGGLIVAGRALSLTLKGVGAVGGKVKYSAEGLYRARNIGKLRYYRVLSWYEQ